MNISVTQAVALLTKGHIIAAPTEAVYGLSVDPSQPVAIQQLFTLKQRDPAKGLILVAATIDQLATWVEWSSLTTEQKERVLFTWPGPVTWILPAKQKGMDTIAVRITDHPVMRELCLACGHALISTSANLSGQEPARTVVEIEQQFGADFPIVAGELGMLAAPTQILDARTGRRVR